MLIGLIGRQEVGKDHFASILVMHNGFTRLAYADEMRACLYDIDPIISITIDMERVHLQQMVDALGWTEVKKRYPEVRRLLQRFGTEFGRNHMGENCWIDMAWNKLREDMGLPMLSGTENIVVTDVRFNNEIKDIRDRGGVLWRIERADMPKENFTEDRYSHASEVDWRSVVPNVVIHNPGPESYIGVAECRNMVLRALDASRLFDLDREYAEDLMPVVVRHSSVFVPSMTREELVQMMGQFYRSEEVAA